MKQHHVKDVGLILLVQPILRAEPPRIRRKRSDMVTIALLLKLGSLLYSRFA